MTSRTFSGTTGTLSYDNLDHFTEWNADSTNQEQYIYDAAGQRVLRRTTSGSSTTLLVYAFGLEEHQYGGAGGNQWNTYYYALAGRLLGSLDGNGTQFYLTDALGSLVSAFTNAAGGVALKGNQLFGPYGNGRYYAGSINTAKGFVGQYNDALTGLDYLHARYYDPVVGVFLSADSVQGNMQGMNPYAYVNGNPETYSDPTGQMPCTSGGYCGWPQPPGGGITGGGASGGNSPPPFHPPSNRVDAPADGNAGNNAPRAVSLSPSLSPSQPHSDTARQVAYRLALWTEFYRALFGDESMSNYAEGAWYITDSAGNILINQLMSAFPVKSQGKAGNKHSEFLLLTTWEVWGMPEALSLLSSYLHEGIKAELHLVVFTQWPACQGSCVPLFGLVMQNLEAQLLPMLNTEPVPIFFVPTRVASLEVFSATSPPNSSTPAPVNSPSDLRQNVYIPVFARTIFIVPIAPMP